MIVGIDLGTTNSAIGVWRNGVAELIPNSLGSVLTPSAVSLSDNGEILTGVAARDRQVSHPSLTATAFKRYMGSGTTIQLGDRQFRPEELSALLLASLKSDAEKTLGEPVTQAVICVPACFNDRQRKAVQRAGQLAGLSVERLVNEPTAAALAHRFRHKDGESRFLVFDLGGGTFDVSVLESFDGAIEVLSSTGDERLGGEDFNAALMDLFRSAHPDFLPGGSTDRTSPMYQRVRDQAERCRRMLSTQQSAQMRVIHEDRTFTLVVTAEEFEKATAGLIERLRAPVVRALQDADVRPELLDDIVLVGGSTRIGVVQRLVSNMFGRQPASQVNPDEAVALGATIQAGLLAHDAALEGVVLADVCPHTLGVALCERKRDGTLEQGLFAPVIERNTLIPASRERMFSTVAHGQRLVEMRIYQGESREVANNVQLGRVEIPVRAGMAGELAVDCRFTYDVNGLLQIDAHDPATDARQNLALLDDPDTVSPAELEQRRKVLAALTAPPRDEQPNLAVLARMQRCAEQALGARRKMIERWISQFRGILEGRKTQEIADARTKLTQAMDSTEGAPLI